MARRDYDEDYAYEDYDDVITDEKPSKNWMISLSLATILALVVIGDTVGGLINVNNRTHVEFGQGITLTLPCDRDGIEVKPTAIYKDVNGTQQFQFDSLLISGLSDQCLTKLFQLKFYNLSGPAFVIGYKNISGATKYDADVVRFLLSRKVSSDPFDVGLNWFTYPNATGLGSPPSPPSSTLCGGENNSTTTINYDFGANNPLPGCPTDNWLAHFQGFIKVPGTDDGVTHIVNFGMQSYGNSEVWIDDNKTLADNSSHEAITSTISSLSLRRGQSYLVDYWIYKGTGKAAAKLTWDLDSNGESTGTQVIIPDTALATASQNIVEIAPTEGETDYTITAVSSVTNDRSVKIQFTRSVNAGQLQYITVETS